VAEKKPARTRYVERRKKHIEVAPDEVDSYTYTSREAPRGDGFFSFLFGNYSR